MKDGIFVSYSHNDTAIVEKIVAVIRDASGKEVWYDHKLRGGENYFSVIANQILDNKYFVFVVSDSSIDSDWCLRELEFAASEKKKIIAVWLDNVSVSPRIKLIIQNTHYINWYSATDGLFFDAVGKAFASDSSHILFQANGEQEEVFTADKKYFLNKSESKKLVELLRSEAAGKYSVCFVPENANLLGIAYELGVSVEPDEKKALFYYKASKYQGNADGKYLYSALMHSREPDVQDHLNEMLDAAENGSPIGLATLADDYYFGRNGFTSDLEKAYCYFERGARLGNAIAMYSTAFGYNKGEVLQQDFEIAYMYALKAKEQGFPRAYRLLAHMYESGKYLEKDYAKAIELYEEAINLGDYLSYCYVGWVYGEVGNIDKKAEAYKKAVEYTDAGEIKSATPYYRLAIIYDDGIGVEQNYDTAAELYLKAAEMNHTLAKKWATQCILNFEGEKKEKLLERAAELKCKGAAYELATIERERCGDDNAKLSDKAVKYYEMGADIGDMLCIEQLLINYSFILGNGDRMKDREQSLKWYRVLFANADEEFLAACREYNYLATYYYAYAIELDLSSDLSAPDREFVLYNFKKSVDESPKYLGRIIGFAVDGYLFPNESGSGLPVDVIHAIEVLEFAQSHLDEYYQYLKTEEPDNYESEKKRVSGLFKKGYRFIASCYDNGKYVPKDKQKAKIYKAMADDNFRF